MCVCHVFACQSVSIETSLCTASTLEPFIAFTFSEALAVNRYWAVYNMCNGWLCWEHWFWPFAFSSWLSVSTLYQKFIAQRQTIRLFRLVVEVLNTFCCVELHGWDEKHYRQSSESVWLAGPKLYVLLTYRCITVYDNGSLNSDRANSRTADNNGLDTAWRRR